MSQNSKIPDESKKPAPLKIVLPRAKQAEGLILIGNWLRKKWRKKP